MNKELLNDILTGFTDVMLELSPGMLAGITITAYAKEMNLPNKFVKYGLPFVVALATAPIGYLAKKRVDKLESDEVSVDILQDVCRDYKKQIEELQGGEA